MKTSTTKIRWGILGTGQIAGEFAKALHDTPGAVLAAVASRSLEQARAFGAKYQVDTCYGSYQELADANTVDAIYIATPHPMHAANAMLALQGGKAVLCEKPFKINRREAQQVVELARAKGLFLMEAMWSRFLPSCTEIKRLIASGAIGTVHQLSADFGFRSTVNPAHRLVSILCRWPRTCWVRLYRCRPRLIKYFICTRLKVLADPNLQQVLRKYLVLR